MFIHFGRVFILLLNYISLRLLYGESRVLLRKQAKFEQNQDLRTFLLNTGDKTLAEATTDKFWGVGIKLDHPNLMDSNHWTGRNVMGNLLMTVRANLQ